jgi:hypothetical protein
MRAIATAESARRRETATARAHRRHQPPQPASRAFQLSFRARWQAWVRTDGEGEPVFERGMLQLDPEKLIPRADSTPTGSPSATRTCSPGTSCRSRSTDAR